MEHMDLPAKLVPIAEHTDGCEYVFNSSSGDSGLYYVGGFGRVVHVGAEGELLTQTSAPAEINDAAYNGEFAQHEQALYLVYNAEFSPQGPHRVAALSVASE